VHPHPSTVAKPMVNSHRGRVATPTVGSVHDLASTLDPLETEVSRGNFAARKNFDDLLDELAKAISKAKEDEYYYALTGCG
jgi:hypothetical protein